MLSQSTIVLGVTGGIAAYKVVDAVRAFKKLGIDVHVIMTDAAAKFVAPLTFQTISGNPVAIDMFNAPTYWEAEHVSLAKKANLFIIAPCTANTLAKVANGIADNLLTSTAIATRAPMLIAPAMNSGMWENAATVRNVEILRGRGVHFVGPETGMLANGDIGSGKMSTADDVVLRARQLLVDKKDFDGRKVLVTAGPTLERLDPVRYMTNKSSGKMGYAIAERAAARGAKVTLVSGPVHIQPPPCVEVVKVETTIQLYQTLIQLAPSQDAILQAAAPCDFRPSEASDRKIKKRNGYPVTLEMTENPDVAAAIGGRKQPGQVLVTFAAETENLLENAREKMTRKNADLMVANNVSQTGAGFDVDTNIVTIISKEAVEACPIMSKHDVADVILDRVSALLSRKK